jgi:hypothetical protein
VEVGWFDEFDNWEARTAGAYVGPAAETDWGRRTLSRDTVHGSSTGAGDLLNLLASVATAEATLPALDPVEYSTARRPFASGAAAAVHLVGGETTFTWFFLRGSWLPQVGVSPLVGVIGGSIRYGGGEWTAGLQLAPAFNANTPPPLTLRGLAHPGLSPAPTLADLDESLTLGDLRHVSLGYGFTADTQP